MSVLIVFDNTFFIILEEVETLCHFKYNQKLAQSIA